MDVPKIVDLTERQNAIAAALVRVALRDGLAATSVRTVGEEAGISPGALRHYFANQDQLLVFALRRVEDTVRQQIAVHPWGEDDTENAVTLLRMLLPLDEQSRAACRLWLEVATLAPHRPVIAPVWRDTYLATREACASAVRLVTGAVTAPQPEVDRLHRFVDGLALHGCYDETLEAARIDAELRSYLADIAARAH